MPGPCLGQASGPLEDEDEYVREKAARCVLSIGNDLLSGRNNKLNTPLISNIFKGRKTKYLPT